MSPAVTTHNDLDDKIRGRTKYVADLHLPGELVGGILRSPHPHARILSIDTRRARAIPGVHAVITAADVPHPPFGPTQYKDWNILARDRVRFIGDEVAAVAAESAEAAAQAIAAIEVVYHPLPAVFDPEEALAAGLAGAAGSGAAARVATRAAAAAGGRATDGSGAWAGEPVVIHDETPDNRPMHIHIERGDVDAAFAKAAIVRGGRYTTNRIYQGHLEPIGVIATWDEAEGLTLITPSHIPYRARETYAAAFGLPEEKVRIQVPPIGGSFGAKYVHKAHLIAAALARAAGRPVRIVFDRYEDMLTAHPRVPLTIDIRIAADETGRFLGKDVTVWGDAGARVYWSPNVLATACSRPDSLYHFGAVRAEGHLMYTNHSPTTCMRGFGNAEMLFAVESVIDEIAEGLGLDPAEVRLRNIVHRGETTVHGYRLDSCELEACVKRVMELSGWSRRKDLPKYRGLGMALGNHVSGYRGIDPRFEGSTAVARLRADGVVEVETGEIDLGQGMSSTYARIAARVLEIDPARVLVKSGDTGRYPFGIGTLASRSTVMGGNAIRLAAERLRDALANFVAEALGPGARFAGGVARVPGPDGRAAPGAPEAGEGGSPAPGVAETFGKVYDLAELARLYRARHAGDALEVRASYTPQTDFPGKDFYGNPSPAYPFAAHVAEVEVDPETGRARVIGYWAVHDAGVVLNRVAATGQVVGGVAQGIGWALMEDLRTHRGAVQNLTLLDYRMPGVADVPPVTVEFVEVPDPHGPFGAKSVGEVAIDPAPAAVANAIAHALGVRGHALPLTAESLWRLQRDARRDGGGA
ncbi:xanthine dehydrogenase family protein molybdopterin-binding subunit [Alicyclobacillus sp.]|uniref:xanthine dehydrogenase family protein molybdopterin-binding subunit n=1 Tax=Alicyclobacillus sp. TaxID=61169 RepID=UPI0025BB9657|nr:xanthine dehydrogenase family protein molybdopterin-binding subunit [Alicyclobacillus sp.]MCL6517562.1 xanthine dehydrogenase family protein molybdopterin-binding subunit [Alicyclobacillus sp.]